MKKIILVCLAAIMSATTVLAAQQSLLTGKSLKILHQVFPEIKQPSLPAFDGTIFNTTKYYSEHDPFSAAGDENISKKALKYFKKKYGNVTNVNWVELDDKYLATFVNEETATKLLFDEKGNLIYSIDYSSENILPYSIKRQVADKYENYKITTVAKINEDSRNTWVINLASETNYATAVVEDGEMHETENFQRAN